MALRLALVAVLLACAVESAVGQTARAEYRVLATNKTSTMEKEMQDAAAAGFRFAAVMGGETSFGGSEVVIVMERDSSAASRYEYRLLATSKTSTMQQELQDAANAGFEYRGQTVFKSAFGGKEVAVVLERHREMQSKSRYEYRLLATKKTSTMQKEIENLAGQGFTLVGLTVGETFMGGTELVTIMRRAVAGATQ